MNFHTQNKKAKKGEQLVIARLQAKGWTVVDASNHEYFQKIDVDLVASKNDSVYLIDVKFDYYPPDNLYIETKKITSGNQGRIFTTRADLWFYLFKHYDIAYIFSPSLMASHVESHDYQKRRARTTNGPYISYSEGSLVPVNKAPIFQTIENFSQF